MSPSADAASVTLDGAFWAATIIFLVSYAVIISEKIHKTIVALLGASLLLVLQILDQKEAFHLEELGVDWNVIFLLVGMMLIVILMRPTGVFEYLAIKSAKVGKGEPFRIMVIFAVVTAVVSAFLDNVTTVLLVAPVTLLIADALEVDPVPFLITEALASNIGGTATLIGDPPNILIGSRAQLDFMQFLTNLGPIVVILMVVFLAMLKLLFRRGLSVRPELKARVLRMDEREAINDPQMLLRSLVVLGIVIVGFTLSGVLGYQPATVAMFGASLLLLLSGTKEPQRALAEVEWPTIFFFIGLFILVGGIVKVGLISWLSTQFLDATHGDLLATSMVVGWFSAIASAFVDNIPYTATMIPLIIDMARQLWPDLQGIALLHNPGLMPIWWSLALGACLGGNGTAIGASANVIVIGVSEQADKRITFLRFMVYGMPVMIVTVAIAMLYVWLRYYVMA